MVSNGKLMAFINALGGGSSGPSEVVILPETELTVNDDTAFIATPLQSPVAAGDTVSATYNGTSYECTCIPGEDGVMFGNLSLMGVEGGNPDAPFVVFLLNDGVDINGDGSAEYGEVMPADGSTTVTISIVQVGAASGGAAESPVVIAKMTGSGDAISIDKTFDEIVALVTSGKIVYLQSINDTAAMTLLLTNYTGSSTPKTLFFAGQNAGKMVVTVTYTPDGVTMGIENH